MSAENSAYDFIIVGAGAAGCVVAARLTEDPGINVLLLEAGKSDINDDRIKIPGNAVATHGSDIDWNYKTVPQESACQAYKGNVCLWPRGKVLGGSTATNGMAYVRGHQADFDSWARLGCKGWDWKNVERYFQKGENFIRDRADTKSSGGAIAITTHPFFTTGAAKSFVKAGVELGYNEVNINSGQNIGFGPFPANIDYEGERSTTATAYLHPSQERPNLTVLTETHVTKIAFQGSVATGVMAWQHGRQRRYNANKEVIVCAGATNTPQLLMLSGIGPKEHLKTIGIKCIADLPVGKNLQDHLQLHLKADVKPGSDVITVEKTKSTTNHSEMAAFVQSPTERANDWPDFQIQPKSLFYHFGLKAPELFPLKDPRFFPYLGFDRAIGDYVRREGYTFQLIGLHPRSTGDITLKDADPFSPPIINPRYLQDEEDVRVFVEAIRFAKKLSQTESMKHLELKFVNLKMPGSIYNEWSDENLEQFVRHFAWTIYHPVGTCKMGANYDKTAVVDPKLRVRGCRRLRVIDASIMPHLTSGNTVAPSIMIGEKGADLIRAEYDGIDGAFGSKL